RFAGGPAKVSIFGSGLFGMISGSSIANTVTVGSLTIPAMIRLGYPRHFEAKKLGMRGLTGAELPVALDVIKRDWPTSIPLFILLIVLFSGFTPYLAAFWGITACMVIGLTNRNPVIAVAMIAVLAAEVWLEILTEWIGLIPLIAGCIG